MELTQPFFVESIPHINESVGASRGERIVHAVERDGIHRINFLQSFIFDPVTFESVFLLLNLRTGVQILHSHAALDGAEDEALFVGEAANAPGLVFKA